MPEDVDRAAVRVAFVFLSGRHGVDPSGAAVLTADDEASETGLLMEHLNKAGIGKPLTDQKLNIYGWIEAGTLHFAELPDRMLLVCLNSLKR